MTLASHTEKKSAKPVRFSRLWCHFTAFLFAFFMVFGRSFAQTDSWDLVFGSLTDGILSLVRGAYWYLLFYWGAFYLFRFCDKVDISRQSPDQPGTSRFRLVRAIQPLMERYGNTLELYPKRTVFCTLLLVNLPYIILSYPAIFMGDTSAQISQGLFVGVPLTNHHPVMHTLFLSLFLHIGQWIGNENIGVFLYCLVQTMVVLLVIAYAVGTLVAIKANRLLILGILLYYCVNPRVFPYLFVVTKDVLYAAFLTLFYVLLFQLLQKQIPFGKREYILLAISAIGMIFTRNDGQYILILTLLGVLFCKGCRKTALSGLGITVVTVVALNQVLYPLLDIAPGSIREMLSVPFQQTARYVRDAGEDVSESEIAVIDQVLDYGSLAEIYDPNLSDSVKATYHGTDEDLKEYFGVWFQMLLRHPGIYIQATMNNYYQYFYPGGGAFGYYSYDWGEEKMEGINGSFQTNFSLPSQFRLIRNGLEALREEIFSLPVLSLLNNPAFYTWIAILFMVYALRRKNVWGVVFSIPMLTQMLIFITGPTNGSYCRYEYPMLVYLPVVVILGLTLIQEHSSTKMPVSK